MKICGTCGQQLMESQFYQVYGEFLMKHCKNCISIQRKQKYQNEKIKLIDYAKSYYKKNKLKQYQKNLLWKKNNIKKINEYQKNYYKKNHNKRFARVAIKMALQRGQLKKGLSCQKCGKVDRLDAHHYLGYKKENWLKIQWLCKKCHLTNHKKFSN